MTMDWKSLKQLRSSHLVQMASRIFPAHLELMNLNQLVRFNETRAP
ncbi:hypothetical protein LEMLEM_LOCUS301 [Lemmus lemmus]